MTSKATFKYLRISPDKIRGVVNMVRGMKIQDAMNALTFCNRNIARDIFKAIKSAAANATQKGGVDVDNLYVSKICVGQGPMLKRWRAKARGMAGKVSRRTSHLTVELKER